MLTSVDDEDKTEVIACIETYEQKIILVCDMQDAILTHLLETLKYAHLLSSAICADDGLEEKLEGILDVFKGDYPGDEHCDSDHGDYDGDHDHDHDGEDDDDESTSTKKSRKKTHDNDYNYKYPCDDKKAKPMPKFPIHASDYYKDLEKGLEKAVEKTKTLEEIWIQSKKKSDKVLSHKNSLSEAIKAAEAAESAK